MTNNRPIKKLWEICKFQNWFAFQSTLFKENWEPILRISNIQNNWFSDNRLVFFDPKDYEKNLDDYLVYPWDLVIAMSWATTWKLAINDTDKKYHLNQRVWKFIFDNDITKKRCHLFLSTKIESNLQQSAGSAIPNLSTEQIKEIQIPLPPLDIQKAIVAKLDEAFAEIDEAIATTQANIEKMNEFTKSVLDKVFEEWDWEKAKMGEIFAIERWWSPRPIQEFLTKESNWVNWIKIWDTKNVWKYIYETEEKIKPDWVKRSRMVYEWDFILSNSMSFWRPYIMKTSWCIHDWRLVIRPNNLVDNEFLYYLLSSPFMYLKFENTASWTWVKNLNIQKVKEIEIPLPPLTKQTEIVKYLDEVFAETSELKSQYQNKLIELKELKASILQGAFEGKLI